MGFRKGYVERIRSRQNVGESRIGKPNDDVQARNEGDRETLSEGVDEKIRTGRNRSTLHGIRYDMRRYARTTGCRIRTRGKRGRIRIGFYFGRWWMGFFQHRTLVGNSATRR